MRKTPRLLPRLLTHTVDKTYKKDQPGERIINSLRGDLLPSKRRVAGSSPAAPTTYRHPPRHYHATSQKTFTLYRKVECKSFALCELSCNVARHTVLTPNRINDLDCNIDNYRAEKQPLPGALCARCGFIAWFHTEYWAASIGADHPFQTQETG